MTSAALNAGHSRKGRASRRRLVLAVLAAMTGLSAVLAIGSGALAIPLVKVFGAVFSVLMQGSATTDHVEDVVVLSLRLPRVMLVGLSGAALGVCGVIMQGLFRNPLADPGLIGVSAGAALAASLVIVLGDRWIGAAGLPFAALPIGAFIGALATTALIYRIATSAGQTSIAILLLAGIAIGALAAAGTGFLVFLADDRQLRDMTFWTLGSFSGATWSKLLTVGPVFGIVLAATAWLARPLDALALGEAEAWHLGIAVERVKTVSIVLVAIGVGACVSVAGIVSFIGIIVPHVSRLIVGPRHGVLLPASACLGATLLLAADTAARTLAAPAELPLGVLMAAIGAPIFLHLLFTQKRLVA